MSITIEDIFRISRILEVYHSAFYELWELGNPILDENIPTAQVEFTDGELFAFKFNPNFWERLTDYERAFVIAHECLHVMLGHGKRLTGKSIDRNIANIATDISIHEIMFLSAGFDKKKINIENIATFESVLSETDAQRNQSAEYYYEYLVSNSIESNPFIFDNHECYTKITKEQIDKLKNGVSSSPSFIKSIKAGTDFGNDSVKVTINKKVKKKWESVVRKWEKREISNQDTEQWRIKNRRMSMLDNSLMIPTEHVSDMDKMEKTEVDFFLDSSGSCRSFSQRFFDVVNSLSPKRFIVNLYGFDTRVYPVSIKDKKLYGFGGTSFSCIEDFLQSKKKYPKTVFIVTDGYGDQVKPQYPDRWYWFISSNYKNCIPTESKVFDLANFE